VTFAIVACDRGAGEVGVAVASKVLAVGAFCPYVRGGVGAVSSQAYLNPYLGYDCVQLMTEGEVLQFHCSPAAKSAGNDRDDRTHGLMHAGDITAANLKTADFSQLSEFLVGTRRRRGRGGLEALRMARRAADHAARSV